MEIEFPITGLLSREESEQWILEHFHPQGLKCPWCQASVERANLFRMTRKSKLKVHRCRDCKHIYNLYAKTVLQQHHLTPQQVVLLLRGILKGETTNELAAELRLNYLTVLNLRRGRGAYANNHPPALGTIGRTSGQVRLRVVHTTQAKNPVKHVHRFTYPNCHVFTDEYESYQGIERQHSTVAHGYKEWARDDEQDDIFEVHTPTLLQAVIS